MKNYTLAFFLLLSWSSFSQNTEPFVFGDALPDAPELAARGTYKVGVRTLEFTNLNQLNIIKSKPNAEVFYDRKIKVEVWYPAEIAGNEPSTLMYSDVLGLSIDPKRPLIPFSFAGRATRDAKPTAKPTAYPLIIVSHGYVGSRYIMSYLTENLASKGYIVVAIDHPESTFSDAGPFASTLLNRSKDIRFIMDSVADLNLKKDNFLYQKIDTQNIGLIGYSMGGYGALNVAGGGYSDNANKFFGSMTSGSEALKPRTSSHPGYAATIDPRIKAVVAFAPWGMERGVWDSTSLKSLKIPTFIFAGSQDDISGYEKGIKLIYKGAVNTDRYMLTYLNARHNIAPNPPPAEALKPGLHFDEYYRYAEPAWNERRINNINQHFVTAFLGTHLKKEDKQVFLDLPPNANLKPWKGFKPRSSVGLELIHDLPRKP